jgi:ATP-binding cassette subfamily C protein
VPRLDPSSERLKAARRYLLHSLPLLAVITLAINILSLTLPLYMFNIYQRVLQSRSIDTVVWLSVIALAALTVSAMFDVVRARVFQRIAFAVMRLLDVPTLQAVIERSIGANSPMAQNGIRDLADIRIFLTGNQIDVPFDILWSPIFFFVLYYMHPLFAWNALAWAVGLVKIGVWTDIVARRPTAEANVAAHQSLLAVNVAIRYGEVIEAMGMRGAFVRRWRRNNNRVLAKVDECMNRVKALAAFARCLRLIAQCSQLALGVILIIYQEASTTSMVVAMVIMSRALLPYEQLVGGWRQWVLAIGAYKRLRDLLLTTVDARQDIDLPEPDGPLVVDRLSYIPPDAARPVLRNISFSLEPGEALGVIGLSAAGKSTLARMLVGLWEPTSGGVYLDGHNTFQWNRENFGRSVGYLPQSVSLLEGTVADNISRLQDVDPGDIIAATKKAGVHEMIGALPHGYETIIGDSLYSLSAGQRQRIGLARALFGSPRLLVLDEPNASLDGNGDLALITGIESAKRDGSIVIVISHKPSIMSVVDKVMILKDGMIDAYGARDEILSQVVPPQQQLAQMRPKRQIRAINS